MFAPQSMPPGMSGFPMQTAAPGAPLFPRVSASHRSRPSADAAAAAATMPPLAPVHPAAAVAAPASARAHRERVRSRSFDHSFVAQLHAFHLAQQAHAQAAALQQAQMQAAMQAQRGFGPPLGATLPHAMQQRLQAHPLLPPPPPPPPNADSHTSASPRLHRERLLREAYLSHAGASATANGANSPPPSPPASHRALAARSAQLQQPGTRSAPGPRGSRTPGGRSRSLAPQWYPHHHHGGGGGGLHNAGGFVGLTTPLFALPGQYPGHGYLPQLGGGGAMGYPLLPHSAGGSRIYGYINTARVNMSPLPPPATAAPGADAHATAANSSDAASATPAATAAELAASAASGAGGKAVRPAPPPGKGQGKSGRKAGSSSQSDLHDESEVIYTDAADASAEHGVAGAHATSSTASAAAVASARAARRARKEKGEKDKDKEKDKPASSGGSGAEAKPSSSAHPKDEGVYGSSAHREQNKARMKEREAAALQRINQAEAERVKAERARAAKDAAEKALKAKQREALAESALARAKQTEQQKAREAALEESERLAREKEKLALARLRSQLPMPTFFSPTLAYALKVESSHNRGDARSPRKMDITRVGKAGAAPSSGATEEKQNGDGGSHAPGHGRRGGGGGGNPHGRKPSLYDGADWDQIRSLHGVGGVGVGEGEDAEALEEGDEAEAEAEGHEEGEGDEHEDGHDDAEAHEEDEAEDAAAAAAGAAAASSTSSTTSAAAGPALSGGRRGHSRSLSTIAREHISAQLSKISSKHTGAHTKLQRLRTQHRQKLAASADEKQRRIDEIRLARNEELRRMAQAITAQELAHTHTPGAKVESQFVLAMPLARAAKAGDLDAIRALAADKEETAGDVRAWVNRHDSAGSTAIFHATWTAHEGVLGLLFSLGADANATNNRQNTALHLACDRAHYGVIRLLLEQGANPLLKNHEGHASFEMQSRNSAESLEMALYIRQCLEDYILEKSARFGGGASAGLELGLGMASVQAAEHTTAAPSDASGTQVPAAAAEGADQSAESHRAEMLAAAAAAAGVGSEAALAAAPGDAASAGPGSGSDPGAAPAAGVLSSSVSTGSLAIPSLAPSSNLPPGLQARLLQTHQYLAGVNAYISARIALSQSIRRVKMKIWSAVRVKLRLGAFSQLRRVDQATEEALAVADAQDQEAADPDNAKETDAAIAEEEEEENEADEHGDADDHAPAPTSDLSVVSIPIPSDAHAADDNSQQQQQEAPAAAE